MPVIAQAVATLVIVGRISRSLMSSKCRPCTHRPSKSTVTSTLRHCPREATAEDRRGGGGTGYVAWGSGMPMVQTESRGG
eukprot:177125-Hanusia_phi.AAC.1